MERLFATDHSATRFAQRVLLAIVFFPHGAQKLLGWFGGQGFAGTMNYFTHQGGLPAIIAFLVITAESLGSIALALGLLARVAAFGIAAVMLGAIATVHWRMGLFMNWTGGQQGEGFEYHLLALGLVVPIIWKGPGAWSIDEAIAHRIRHGRGAPVGAAPVRA